MIKAFKRLGGKGLLMSLGILLIIFISFSLNSPPDVIPADAPANLFSASRALPHLEEIASKPNPIGSHANDDVRDYIFQQLKKLGHEPAIQQSLYYDNNKAARLSNVVLRIRGTGKGRAILIVGHYDTVINAPGAADNGAAVVSMIEVIRMLAYHPQLENDLIFLFSDGEEYGLLGAEMFAVDHKWMPDVEFVINMEAMGTRGPVTLFETSENNYRIIKEFVSSVPFPMGNSLSYEVYKRMPNNTDFEVFKKRGINGLNFAFIGNSFDYHTAGDNIENIDRRSIQHHGSYIAALILKLGNSNINFDTKKNAVYFNTIGKHMVLYPYALAPYLSVLTFIALMFLIFLGYYLKHLSTKGLLRSIIAVLLLPLMLYLLSEGFFQFILSFFRGSRLSLLEYNMHSIATALVIMAVAFSAVFFSSLLKGLKVIPILSIVLIVLIAVFSGGIFSLAERVMILVLVLLMLFLLRSQVSTPELMAAALILWSVMSLITGFFLQGASWLFVWPLLFSLPTFARLMLKGEQALKGPIAFIFILLFSIPLLVWFPWIIHMLLLAMGLKVVGISLLVVGLAGGLLIPHYRIITGSAPRILPALLFVAGLTFLLIATLTARFDDRHRMENLVVCAVDSAENEAYWLIENSTPDEYTTLFISENPDMIDVGTFYPHKAGLHAYGNKTDFNIPEAKLKVLSDSVVGGERVVKIHIKPQIHISELQMFFKKSEEDLFLSIENNDRIELSPFAGSDYYLYTFYAPSPEGEIITLYTLPGKQVFMHINELNYEIVASLPGFSPRPPYMMNGGDRLIISKGCNI